MIVIDVKMSRLKADLLNAHQKMTDLWYSQREAWEAYTEAYSMVECIRSQIERKNWLQDKSMSEDSDFGLIDPLEEISTTGKVKPKKKLTALKKQLNAYKKERNRARKQYDLLQADYQKASKERDSALEDLKGRREKLKKCNLSYEDGALIAKQAGVPNEYLEKAVVKRVNYGDYHIYFGGKHGEPFGLGHGHYHMISGEVVFAREPK